MLVGGIWRICVKLGILVDLDALNNVLMDHNSKKYVLDLDIVIQSIDPQ